MSDEEGPAGLSKQKFLFLKAIADKNEELVREHVEENPALAVSVSGLNYGGIHNAVYLELFDTVRLLLDYGADVNANSYTLGSPLCIAAAGGNGKLAALLLEYGADVSLQSPQFKLCPLPQAADNGHTAMIRFLLSHGADPNVRGMLRITPLAMCLSDSKLECAKLLLEAGADPCAKESKSENSLLHNAVRQRQPGIAKLLLAFDAQASAVNAAGDAPLHVAAGNKDIEMMRVLCSHGADPSATNKAGLTSLQIAAEQGLPHKDLEGVFEPLERKEEGNLQPHVAASNVQDINDATPTKSSELSDPQQFQETKQEEMCRGGGGGGGNGGGSEANM